MENDDNNGKRSVSGEIYRPVPPRGIDSGGGRGVGFAAALKSLGIAGGITYLAHHGKIDGSFAVVSLLSLAAPELAHKLIDLFRGRK